MESNFPFYLGSWKAIYPVLPPFLLPLPYPASKSLLHFSERRVSHLLSSLLQSGAKHVYCRDNCAVWYTSTSRRKRVFSSRRQRDFSILAINVAFYSDLTIEQERGIFYVSSFPLHVRFRFQANLMTASSEWCTITTCRSVSLLSPY